MNTEHNSNIYFKKLHCKNRTPCNISNNLNVENDVLIKSLKNNEENIINRKDINKNLGNVIYNISKLIHNNTSNNILISEEQPSFVSIENQNNNYREMDTHLRISMDNAENNNLFLTDEKNDFQNNMNSTCYNKKEEKMKFLSNYKYNTNIPTCNGNVINNNIKNGVLKNGKNKFHFFANTKSYDQTMKEGGNGNPCNNMNNLLDVQKCEEQNMKREIEQFFDFPLNNDAKKNPSDGHHYVYQNANYAEMAGKNYNFPGESDHPLHTIEYRVSANEKVKHSNVNSQIVMDVKEVKNARDIKDLKDVKDSRDSNDARDANGARDVIDVNFVNDVRRPKSNKNFKNIVITNVFLGNIPPNITEERLKNVLEIFGYIIHIEYKWSMDKWSYAFVYFIDETCAINAVNILNQKKFFDNSPNHKLICFIVSKQIPNQNTLHYSKANFSLLKDGPPGANLFLYGIPLKWTELNLIQLVNKYGHVVGLRIPYINNENDRKQGNRGFGFVSYDNKKSAIEAFEDLSKMYIHGKLLKVQLKNGEEHLLPAKLKSIYNTNKNKVKDSNNTKTAQSLVSTTDTLKTLNSVNSTDVKNPKNKFLDGSNSINNNRNVSGANVNNSINSSSRNGNGNGSNNMNSMNSMNSTNSTNNMNNMSNLHNMNTTANVNVNENVIENVIENVNSVNNISNIKPVHFITNKNKANHYMCSNSTNKLYQHKFTPVGANLFLYGIPLKWTELNLIQLVNKYGHVVGLRIPYINNENDRKQGNRGFGFVSYDNKKSAIEAFEDLSKMYIHGKLLKVQLKNGEEHLLPAKLKSIYNTNKNKVKDSNNTKTAQSLVSTTDTLKTLNSVNSTDVKNPKNKFLDGSNSINNNRNVSGANVNNSINSSSRNGNGNGSNNMNSMNSMNSTNSTNNMNNMSNLHNMNTTANVNVNENVIENVIENVNSVNNISNIKPVHFITNKNKANHYMCSNSTNKLYQHKFTPVGNCPIDMLENPLKNNSPFGNSSDLDSSSSIYTNTKTFNNFFDHVNKCHPSSNRKTNSYVPNLQYNHTINAVPNEFNGAPMRLYNTNDKSVLGGHVVGNKALGFINANGYAGDNAVGHTKGYADGWAKGHANGEMSEDVNAFEQITENKYMNTVDGKMKNITVRNEIPTYDYMNNKIYCTNAYVDNADLLDRGKKFSWKKRKNFPLVIESKDKLLSKTFNQTSKMDLNNNDYGNVSIMKCPYNYFEEKNIDKNEFPKLSILKGSKMYTSNRNSTMYSSNELESGNINICNKMYVNNGKIFAPAYEKMGGTYVGSTISDEPFKCNSKIQLCNANKNISAFLNNIWYNEDDNNSSTDKKGDIKKDNGATQNTDENNSVVDSTHIHHECAKYGCDHESAHELESCRKNSQRDRNRIVKCSHETEEAHNERNNFNQMNKCFYHNGDINKENSTDEKDCMRSNSRILNEEHINIPFYTNCFEDTCIEKKCAHEKENATNYFKNRHLFLSLLNTYANENSLNINDYVNKENTELYDMISSNFDNHLDKKELENLFKQFLARNKENEKQQEWEGQHGGGRQHEKQTEKRGEGGEKSSEKYNSISRLRQNEENSIIYPRNSNLFNTNFSSNFYKDNNVCNNNKNEQGKKTYSQHNDDYDDIVDPCLSDIYIFNDYMSIHNYDDSLFNFELENDDKNCISEKKYDNNIFMNNFEDSFNKYLLQHDENNNNNVSNDVVNKYTKGV
ncbi:RNA-binding protein, putative (UIS12) [Plasmodium ovale curtisi]|uniref:RNA-binding protein, putative (UIS12) n=1 Tax=Plasmodium ovale curtisi TaxID=864141 RepID=A0A1A8VLJ0_PLAOA|nr:RNA-binding protein, putative (UIS12) [Plasmodium ovale curtisi]